MNPRRKTKLNVDERAKQELPKELMDGWMATIREQLSKGRDEKEFFSGQRIYRQALTYIAFQLDKKAVTLPAERYAEIVRGVLLGIRLNGRLEEIKYLPRYVLHCFQEHWRHHGEAYYEEGKSVRNQTDNVFRAISKLPLVQSAPTAVSTLAQVHQVLAQPRKRACKGVEKVVQGELF